MANNEGRSAIKRVSWNKLGNCFAEGQAQEQTSYGFRMTEQVLYSCEH